MKKLRTLKIILASLLVTTALAAPAAVLSGTEPEPEAELYFTGVSLEMLPDGSVQAVFEVGVARALNCNGATFILDYNPDYFTPSYMSNSALHKKNEKFTPQTEVNDDGFFAYDKTLYKPDVNPFRTEVIYGQDYDPIVGDLVDKTSKYSTVVMDQHRIVMDLLLDEEKITETGKAGKLAPVGGVSLEGPMGAVEETRYVINKYDTKDTTDNVTADEREELVALGTLSFSVEPDRLDEIARYFPDPAKKKNTVAEVKMDNGGETYLIRTASLERTGDQYDPLPADQKTPDNWQIAVYKSMEKGNPMSQKYYREHADFDPEDYAGPGARYYELAVDPKQIMKVRPAEKEVTINAYQAFTNGDWGDVAQALQRYSPMATITYVDGTEENVVIPWGQAGDNYEYTLTVLGEDGKFHPVDMTANSPAYDPTHGVYQATQYVPGKNRHPIPITVTLTVTPIHLVNMEVENQVLTYNLNEVVNQVASASDLELPETARLITDIVPSGISMVMDIPGWTPEKGEWPRPTDSNSATMMNALKEDGFGSLSAPPGVDPGDFDTSSMPYWPDDGDNGAIQNGQYWRFMKQKNNNWIGEYTFHMAESLGGTRTDGFTKTEIKTKFAWLTVDKEHYVGEADWNHTASGGVVDPLFNVPPALRQLVTEESFTNEAQYTASWVSTVVAGNGQPELTLSVQRKNTPMSENSIFRVWLPNGLELGTGGRKNVWPSDDETTTVADWFDGTDGNYHTEKQEMGNRYFHLVTNPGDPEKGDDGADRETLRRYINLGGWYQVTVCEEPGSRTWSDPIPVWVPPRPNEYLSDKIYNFVGENTELFHWPGGLTHYVTMPQGTFTAVTRDGLRLYNVATDPSKPEETTPMTVKQISEDDALKKLYLDDKGRPKTGLARYEERYGYNTTYDGSTGAQPGTLHSFQLGVDSLDTGVYSIGNPWLSKPDGNTDAYDATPQNQPIEKYGETAFYDGATYPSYGKVTQPAATDYTATVRRGETYPKTGNIRITLTSESPTGITREPPGTTDCNVTLATYDTKTEGYTDRQPYTFTITNVGTEPIYGLSIDGLTDGYYQDTTGGRFVLLQPPATFLAPGQSTNFEMTYVYNLPHNDNNSATEAPPVYRDTLYITCSQYPNGGQGKRNQDHYKPDGTYDPAGPIDYLLDFDAEFTVSDKRTHTVTVIVNPSYEPNGSTGPMGDGGLIVGELNGTGAMNYTVTTRAYSADNWVYVAVYMKDEYTLMTNPPNVVDAAGNKINLVEERTETGRTDIRVYRFRMPDSDAVVYINFKEGILSKLRLSDLIDFSAGTKQELKPDSDTATPGTDPVAGEKPYEEGKNTYKVWRKTFTDKDYTDAATWVASKGSQDPEKELYLMTAGTTVRRQDGGNQFISTEDQYIVVIPWSADWSQVEVKLRALETHMSGDSSTNYENREITPDVVMHHYGADIRDTWSTAVDTAVVVCSQKGSTVVTTGPTGTTGPSVHTSERFLSPEQGTSNYVRITLSYEGERRSYYLEIHRAPREPIAQLDYGNSPYGMIMNDSLFGTTAAQNAAKAAFVSKGYSFRKTEPSETPLLVRDANPAVTRDVVYWREAWVHNTQLFEPESLTGFTFTYEQEKDADGNPTGREIPTTSPDPDVYKDGENLDLNDYAFFATLGENMLEPGIQWALDSTGRKVDPEDIHARVTVTLLDTEAATQIGRFSGDEEVTLDMGVAGKLLTGLQQPAVMNAAKKGTWPVTSETKKDLLTGEETTTYAQVENIRPGQYVMEYVYEDYNGEPLTVTRPFVILSAVGDVDASGGSVDTGDETLLKNRVADPLGYVAGGWDAFNKKETDVYPRSNIFKYRVVDVNNDRNINNIDGNLIHKLAGSSATSKATAIRFYNPTRYRNRTSGTGTSGS